MTAPVILRQLYGDWGDVSTDDATPRCYTTAAEPITKDHLLKLRCLETIEDIVARGICVKKQVAGNSFMKESAA